MSFTSRTATAETRRHLALRPIVMAVGLMIAVASLAALAFWEGDKAAPVTDAGKSRIILSSKPEERYTDFIYYLVDSEAQRDSVLEVEANIGNEAARHALSAPKRYVEVYVAPDAQVLRSIGEAMIEIPMFGNGVQLIDLRSK